MVSRNGWLTEVLAAETDWAWLRPKPRPSVTWWLLPGVTFSIAAMWPFGAEV